MLQLSQLIGNESIKRNLERMVHKQAIANSLLFAGPDGIGKSQFALALAALILSQDDPTGSHRRKIESGNHPDIHIYRPEGKLGLHSIASLRQFCEEVHYAPNEAKWKIFIIQEADRMLSYSANALLKTFEEPTPNTLIILVSSSPELLLPTVMSRCRKVYFHPLSDEEIGAFLRQRYTLDDEAVVRLSAQANGSIGRAIQLAEQGSDPTRQFMLTLLSQGKVGTYKALTQAVQTINEQIEAKKKQIEEAARLELKAPTENLSAAQQQMVEKELDGVVSTRISNEADALFSVIQTWYRDLHLMLINGDRNILFNRDIIPALEQALQQGYILPLEIVEKALKEAKLALQRSTSLTICLENLFLKLNLL